MKKEVILLHGSGISVVGIIMRFILGGGAVAASYIFARILGGRWGGIFAAFPAVYVAAVVTVAAGLPEASAVPLTIQVSKGALVGMTANIACSIAAFFLITRVGWKKGLAGALGVWSVLVVLIYEAVYNTGMMR